MTGLLGSVFTLVVEALLLVVLIRVGRGLLSDGFRVLKPVGCGILVLLAALWLLSLPASRGGSGTPFRIGSGQQAAVSPKAVEE
ncbi:MAG: hypothetical protein WAL64_07745 [Candidatus Dormiibacterota bacterium]